MKVKEEEKIIAPCKATRREKSRKRRSFFKIFSKSKSGKDEHMDVNDKNSEESHNVIPTVSENDFRDSEKRKSEARHGSEDASSANDNNTGGGSTTLENSLSDEYVVTGDDETKMPHMVEFKVKNSEKKNDGTNVPITDSSNDSNIVGTISDLEESCEEIEDKSKMLRDMVDWLERFEGEHSITMAYLREKLQERDKTVESLKTKLSNSIEEKEKLEGRLKETEEQNECLRSEHAQEVEELKVSYRLSLEEEKRKWENDLMSLRDEFVTTKKTAEERADTPSKYMERLIEANSVLKLRTKRLEWEIRSAKKLSQQTPKSCDKTVGGANETTILLRPSTTCNADLRDCTDRIDDFKGKPLRTPSRTPSNSIFLFGPRSPVTLDETKQRNQIVLDSAETNNPPNINERSKDMQLVSGRAKPVESVQQPQGDGIEFKRNPASRSPSKSPRSNFEKQGLERVETNFEERQGISHHGNAICNEASDANRKPLKTAQNKKDKGNISGHTEPKRPPQDYRINNTKHKPSTRSLPESSQFHFENQSSDWGDINPEGQQENSDGAGDLRNDENADQCPCSGNGKNDDKVPVVDRTGIEGRNPPNIENGGTNARFALSSSSSRTPSRLSERFEPIKRRRRPETQSERRKSADAVVRVSSSASKTATWDTEASARYRELRCRLDSTTRSSSLRSVRTETKPKRRDKEFAAAPATTTTTTPMRGAETNDFLRLLNKEASCIRINGQDNDSDLEDLCSPRAENE